MGAGSSSLQRRKAARRRRRRERSELDYHMRPSIRLLTGNAAAARAIAGAVDSARFATSSSTALGMNCDQNMPLLYSLARSWAWGAVEYRCMTHPAEAAVVDYLGDNALHWVVFGRPPLQPVKALLETDQNLASVPNRKGHLPLHVACSYRASPEVIAALIQAYPPAAGTKTTSGSYPLHLLCDFGCSVGALRLLLQNRDALSGVFEKDPLYNRRPLEILSGRKNLHEFQRTRDVLRKTRKRQRAIREEGAEGLEEELRRLDGVAEKYRTLDFWKKVAMLMLVEHAGEEIPASTDLDELVGRPEILRACVANPLVPPSIQDYAILLYGDLLERPDENGNLPLHIAVSTGSSSVIQDLVDAAPKAAAVRNHDGDTPLAIMLRQSEARWSHGIGCLIKANPSGVIDESLDPRLYPLLWGRLSSSADVLYSAVRGKPDVFHQVA